jgi:CubicO group peptidase (beta-lactamase class C family)
VGAYAHAMAGPVDTLFSGAPGIGRTDALLVTRHGETVIERYGEGIGADTRLRSWSMAKSVLHAAVGILVAEGALDLDAPAPVAAWAHPDDPRRAITLRHLMVMRSGLAWTEAPVGRTLPDVVTMFYGNDHRPFPDCAAWAADRPLAHSPGERLHYSSANSIIVSSIVRDLVGAGDAYEAWLHRVLFDPLGMSPRLRFDEAGTWLASSYCSCTAREFERFGRLYLDGGMAEGTRLLPAEWVATADIDTGTDEEGRTHTMHWWRFADTPWFHASGYLGQHIVVVPPLDLVVVRTGETATTERDHVVDALVELIGSFDR